MPRTRKRQGGARQGQPGQAYPQRTDLNAQKIAVAPGQTYGKGAEQEAAQRALPMAGQAPVPPPGGAAAPPATGPGPGAGGAFSRPTDRPDEPMTAGVPMGPGPGPEALAMSQFAADPDLAAMAAYLPTLELLASQPNASPSARNYVRRLRGALGTASLNTPGQTGPHQRTSPP